MDKNAIKKYAVWARRELIARVSQKAEQYGITEKEIIDERAESIHGVVLTPAQKNQRHALIRLIRRDGYQQAMEEVAYTWFNRFIALRFMEVNDYLPEHTRAFTDEQNAFKPKILADALNLELTNLNLDKIIELKAVDGARYTVPSTINIANMDDLLTVRFRVGAVFKNAFVSVYYDDERIQHQKKRIMAPGEMEQIILQKKKLVDYPDLKTITIKIEQE